MLVNRRGVLAGLGAVLAAPAIVHAGNLMPVRSIERLLQKGPMIRMLSPDGVVLGEIPLEPIEGRLAFPAAYHADIVHSLIIDFDGVQRLAPVVGLPRTLAAGDSLSVSGIDLTTF